MNARVAPSEPAYASINRGRKKGTLKTDQLDSFLHVSPARTADTPSVPTNSLNTETPYVRRHP